MTVELDELTECRRRLRKMRERKDTWKAEAERLGELWDVSIVLPGRHQWAPTVERWRSLVHTYLLHYGGVDYAADQHRVLDQMLGIMSYESWSKRCPFGGDPRAISTVEWVGTPPPGYNPDNPATRASGLFQIPPAYWADRSRAAGYEGMGIFDADANTAVACYMLYASWPEGKPAPHWHHWSAAHVGRKGSYEKALEVLAEVRYP